MSTVESRVRAGATLLDSMVVGWAEQIDVSRLNLQDCIGCILGQCFDIYGNGKRQLGLNHRDAVAFGFHSAADHTMKAAAVEYRLLRSAWLAEIAARLELVIDETELSPVAQFDSPL